ncbi:hypothetical protein RM780_04460 [Streptomyces sp. DSM 44917]|uniref:Uncharacterized protein n=1 Tax=Streptomyces boetiae TaxID=3075541 RepID=A0ABU2L3T3_9ACTN|nr:hypothetical protein [Streptomyces sp. DSM 44917]MDT0306214.1 hypothetical protein [Streptomyces sp. DSM 44917]
MATEETPPEERMERMEEEEESALLGELRERVREANARTAENGRLKGGPR